MKSKTIKVGYNVEVYKKSLERTRLCTGARKAETCNLFGLYNVNKPIDLWILLMSAN